MQLESCCSSCKRSTARTRDRYVTGQQLTCVVWLVGGERIRILGCNAPCRLQKSIEWLESWQLRATMSKRLDHFLRGDVPHQGILREGAPAESAEHRIKPAAPRVVGRQYFLDGLIGAAVQVNADVKIVVLRHHRADQIADLLGSRHAYGVSQRDHVQIFSFEQVYCIENLVGTPQISVRISEGHGDINHHFKSGTVGFFLNLLEFLERVFSRLILILAQECLGN